MKTAILIFVFFVSITKASNDPNWDLKPVMQDYLAQVSVLTEKISLSNQPDSIKLYAKQLMLLSNKMERQVNLLFNYGGNSAKLIPLIGLYPTYSLSYALVNMGQNATPAATKLVNDIYDCASRIRFFCSNSLIRRNKNLKEIESLKKDLQFLMMN